MSIKLVEAIRKVWEDHDDDRPRWKAIQAFEDALNEVIDQRVQKALAEQQMGKSP